MAHRPQLLDIFLAERLCASQQVGHESNVRKVLDRLHLHVGIFEVGT
jgi:hypothetical protein